MRNTLRPQSELGTSFADGFEFELFSSWTQASTCAHFIVRFITNKLETIDIRRLLNFIAQGVRGAGLDSAVVLRRGSELGGRHTVLSRENFFETFRGLTLFDSEDSLILLLNRL